MGAPAAGRHGDGRPVATAVAVVLAAPAPMVTPRG